MPDTIGVHTMKTSHGLLAWREDGPATGAPLVLLQRYRGTMDDWDPAFIEALARERRVIRFDSAGIGRSSGKVPESIAGMAAVAAEIIDGLGSGPVDVLGWSLGGEVGLQLALDFPQLVRRLVVAGSTPGPIPDGPKTDPRVLEVMTKSENDESDFLFLFYPETETARAVGRASLACIRERADRGPVVDRAAFMAQVKAIAGWSGVLSRVGNEGSDLKAAGVDEGVQRLQRPGAMQAKWRELQNDGRLLAWILQQAPGALKHGCLRSLDIDLDKPRPSFAADHIVEGRERHFGALGKPLLSDEAVCASVAL